MFDLPTTLTPAAFESDTPVYPASIDKLRVPFQHKLGWSPLAARAFFAPWKRIAIEANGYGLALGPLLSVVKAACGADGALVALRAVMLFQHGPRRARERR